MALADDCGCTISATGRHHMIPDDGAGHVLSKHCPCRPKLHRDGQLIEHTDSPPDGPQSAQKSPGQVIPTPG